MKLFSRREKFSPNLIDLVEYEKSLLYCREHGRLPIPVQPIPDKILKWSSSEMQIMRENRQKTYEIKNRIFPDT